MQAGRTDHYAYRHHEPYSIAIVYTDSETVTHFKQSKKELQLHLTKIFKGIVSCRLTEDIQLATVKLPQQVSNIQAGVSLNGSCVACILNNFTFIL